MPAARPSGRACGGPCAGPSGRRSVATAAAAAAGPARAGTSGRGRTRRAAGRTRRRRTWPASVSSSGSTTPAPLALRRLVQVLRRRSADCRAISSRRFAQASAMALQQRLEPGPAVAVVGREVGAAVERLQVGREEDRQRPAAALLGQHLDGASCRSVSRSGRSSRSTLMQTKCSFMTSAVASSSKLSCSMTWHQWHAE